MRFQKSEFCEKCDFKNGNLVKKKKNVISVMRKSKSLLCILSKSINFSLSTLSTTDFETPPKPANSHQGGTAGM